MLMQHVRVSFITLTLVTACLNDLSCGGEATQLARVLSFSAGGGKVASALVLQPKDFRNGIVTQDHLILIDTSASQVGEHRQQSLSVLAALLKSLPADHRVRLFAADIQAESLDDGFSRPGSEAVEESLELLKSRVPLGATDLGAVLRTALLSISDRPTDITYIGDGMSAAKLVDIPDLRSLVAELRRCRVPVHSFVVGSQKNLELLGILALQTGGVVAFDSQVDTTQVQVQNTNSAKLRADIAKATASAANRAIDQGQKLAAALTQPVFFPKNLRFTATEATLLPTQPLPVRTDRETIYVADGPLQANATVVLEDTDLGIVLKWKLAVPFEQPDAMFLPQFVSRLESTGGLTNSLAGLTLFRLAQVDYLERIEHVARLGQQALQRGEVQRARDISRVVMNADPRNLAAKALRDATGRLKVRTIQQTTQTMESGEVGYNDEVGKAPNPNANLVEEQSQLIRVQTMKLRNEVGQAVTIARQSDDSYSGLGILKQALGVVRSAIDIAPDDRQRMEKQLQTEILREENRKEQLEQEQSRRIQRMAQQESLKRVAEQAMLDEERLENLIDRVRALMLEGRHGRDDAFSESEEVANVAINMRPGEGTSAAARFDSESALQLTRAYRMRARRADQYLETMYQVELSHVPFPDEPPIRFPPAEVWKALSARRKERATVDLKRTTPNERRIQKSLSETTEVSFTDNPLEEALNYLEDLHHIEIWMDKQALQDEGINADTQVTLVMSGITLRSVLRLLLEPLALTYIIEDEVMKITTQTKADEKMSTRVYPVADLVVPIRPPMMMGGMGGGMMGGMGGGMGGGMMGGMGGMGGGMMGGGGMFNVPPEAIGVSPNRKKPLDLIY